MIVSPWGEVLAEAGTEPCVVKAELDIKAIKDVRQQMPCFSY
jgi:predicted amidohydrolase